jgi:predicted negative regulator of RcsB-dependent stress response
MSKIDMTKLRSFTDAQSYPVDKAQVQSNAKSQNLDEELANLINEIPETQYASQDELIHAVREVESQFQTGVWRTPKPRT